MDPEAVATLSAITGLPPAEAEGFLEMGALQCSLRPRRPPTPGQVAPRRRASSACVGVCLGRRIPRRVR